MNALPEVQVNPPVGISSLLYENRELTPDDLDAVAELEAQCFPDPWPRQAFEIVFDYPILFRGLWAGDSLAAYALALCFDKYMHLINLAVNQFHRRAGLGRKLIDFFQSEAISSGYSMILLEVRADNDAARSLYDRTGFIPLQSMPRYYPDGGDALLLYWLPE